MNARRVTVPMLILREHAEILARLSLDAIREAVPKLLRRKEYLAFRIEWPTRWNSWPSKNAAFPQVPWLYFGAWEQSRVGQWRTA